MAKTIIKESLIVLLMIVAIALLLVFAFYDYIPLNKPIPVQVKSYEMSNEIKEEIGKNAITGEQTIVKTYTIESTELSVYEKNKDYNAGKYNPFALDDEDSSGGNNINGNNINGIYQNNINSLK